MADLTSDDLALIRRALDESDDALGALRRMHGFEVTELCYPARNTVAEALEMLTAHGILPIAYERSVELKS